MADCRKCIHNYKMPGDEPRCNRMCDGESDYEPITNAMKIRKMSDEELAEFINGFSTICELCNLHAGCCNMENTKCKNGILEWLQSDAE